MRFNGDDAAGMFRQAMLALAKSVDTILNGEDALAGKIERQTGFVLMVYSLDRPDITCTVANVAGRAEIMKMFEAEIKTFNKEEAPE